MGLNGAKCGAYSPKKYIWKIQPQCVFTKNHDTIRQDNPQTNVFFGGDVSPTSTAPFNPIILERRQKSPKLDPL